MPKEGGRRKQTARSPRTRGAKTLVDAPAPPTPRELLLLAALDATADGLLVVDSTGKIVLFNERFARMWQIPQSVLATRSDEAALAHVLKQLVDPKAFIHKVHELYAHPESESFDTLRFLDGRVFERFSTPQRVGGKPVGRVWSFRDVTERQRALESLSAQMELRQRRIDRLHGLWRIVTHTGMDRRQLAREALIEGARALGLSSGLIAHREGDKLVLDVSTSTRTTEWLRDGRRLEETLSGRALARGRTTYVADFSVDPDLKELALNRELGLRSGIAAPLRVGAVDYVLSYADSEPRSQPFDDEDVSYVELLAAFFGRVYSIMQQESDIAYLAFHDALTELPNRPSFHQRLNELIPHSRRTGRRFALLYVDLDRFKQVNDTLGHAAGDVVLREAAQRLSSVIRGDEVLARLGGDEFAVLVPEVDQPAGVEVLAKRLCDKLSAPFKIDNHNFYITGSIGIVMFPHDGATADELLANVDAAMYRAKEEGRNHYRFYSEEIAARLRERQGVQEGLRQALARRELRLYYQPIVNMRSRDVVGAEALLRWRRADGSVAEPASFLGVAEETGLMVPIGQWVLDEALTRCATMHPGVAGFRLAVNFSTSQFQDPEFCERLSQSIRKTGVDPTRLAIEITESVALHNPDAAHKTLTKCREQGLEIVLDDFGTFYSSLAYLKRLPVDVIKIDRLFVRGLPHAADDCAIVKSIIALCTSLGRRMVAEGVETDEQASWLLDNGCDVGQGYFFAKPAPVAD